MLSRRNARREFFSIARVPSAKPIRPMKTAARLHGAALLCDIAASRREMMRDGAAADDGV